MSLSAQNLLQILEQFYQILPKKVSNSQSTQEKTDVGTTVSFLLPPPTETAPLVTVLTASSSLVLQATTSRGGRSES